MTTAVLLRSGMMGNYHVPFWRAVEEATPSLTLIILLKAVSRDGQSQSNAKGVETSTLLGASLVEQVLSVKLESPRL
jgi:hypothetical protein